MHIALLAPDIATANSLRERIRVIQPPLWPGKVSIHIIPEDQRNKHKTIDVRILQAAVDLGLIDSSDVEIGPPSEVTIGYPSGDSK